MLVPFEDIGDCGKKARVNLCLTTQSLSCYDSCGGLQLADTFEELPTLG